MTASAEAVYSDLYRKVRKRKGNYVSIHSIACSMVGDAIKTIVLNNPLKPKHRPGKAARHFPLAERTASDMLDSLFQAAQCSSSSFPRSCARMETVATPYVILPVSGHRWEV